MSRLCTVLLRVQRHYNSPCSAATTLPQPTSKDSKPCKVERTDGTNPLPTHPSTCSPAASSVQKVKHQDGPTTRPCAARQSLCRNKPRPSYLRVLLHNLRQGSTDWPGHLLCRRSRPVLGDVQHRAPLLNRALVLSWNSMTVDRRPTPTQPGDVAALSHTRLSRLVLPSNENQTDYRSGVHRDYPSIRAMEAAM